MKMYGYVHAACAVWLGATLSAPLCAAAAPLPYRPAAERTVGAGPYKIGSSNTVTADPPVPHPNETPCVVTLFRDKFVNFNSHPFSYTPPAACPGPWAKVVLDADFGVTAGVQYDRTGQISIANVNIYYGTTAEPGANLAPHWHVERDLTDETALLESSHNGEADLGNLVNNQYTGVIVGTAHLKFYPAQGKYAAAQAPDVVLPVPNVPGGAQQLMSGTSTLSATYTFPSNVERAYLDVFAQSQNADEFWYTCVPNDLSQALNSCPGTAFRETEIAVDGTPAGVAPVYPWIFTGGIDPYLWFPIPGVQTLNFKPYRVDLTPFAARLDDGNPHTISFGVFNADNYFLGTSTLLLYVDHGATRLTGALTRDTLSAQPSPVVQENVQDQGGYYNGTLSVSSQRLYDIEGYVSTPHGRITTKLDGAVHFTNGQRFVNSATASDQDIRQDTVVDVLSARTEALGHSSVTDTFADYPLAVDINTAISPNLYKQHTTIHQRYVAADVKASTFSLPSFDYADNAVATTDVLDFDGSFHILGNSGQASSQRYLTFDSAGACYERSIAAANNALTGVVNGCERPADAEALVHSLQTRAGSIRQRK